MFIADVMERVVKFVGPDQTVWEAVEVMEREDIGALPVIHNGRPIGMLTDRDVAMRVDRYGKDPKATKVRDVVTERLVYCREDQTVDEVLKRMFAENVRRIPVLSHYGHGLVGIVSLDDLAAQALENKFVGMILAQGSHRSKTAMHERPAL